MGSARQGIWALSAAVDTARFRQQCLQATVPSDNTLPFSRDAAESRSGRGRSHHRETRR
jgi:hypothetical protein